MKLQVNLLITFLISSFISIIVSLLLINIFINLFDKSYNRYDIEKISLNMLKEINTLKEIDKNNISLIFTSWKKKFNNIDFSYVDPNGKPIYSTSTKQEFKKRDFRDIEEMKKRIEEEEKRVNQKINRNFKFIDYFDNRDIMILKPLIKNDDLKGAIILTVKREFSPPFVIRINKEKILFLYIVLFVVIAVLIFFSYIMVILFTMPIIKRLNLIVNKIKNFELDKPNIKINDNKKDEISIISNTFNIMADKINQDYNEKMKFYQERQELIKNISHDFRTPLTSILGYSTSLDDGLYENEEEQKKYYKIIRKKADYMSKLFDELLELSRLDNNKFILKKTDFDIAELIRELIIEYLPQLEKEDFFIDTNIADSLFINGDKDRLSRAMRNIIDNVLKHGYAGKFIGFSANEGIKDLIHMEIIDKGKSINDKELDKIFDRFYHNSQHSGRGLGLSIAKEIIEKHNGTIIAEKNIYNGLTITIDLPRKT